MIGVYVGAALFGCIVIGVSLLTGGKDHGGDDGHDHDHGGGDHDHDHDHDHEIEKATPDPILAGAPSSGPGGGPPEAVGADMTWVWAPFLSMRFWTFFLAAGGVTGTLLTLVSFQEPLVGVVSVPFGGAIGWASAQVFRKIRTDTVSASTSLASYAGLEAKVIIPVRPGDIGKIALQTAGGRIEMPAKTRDGTVLEAGSMVLIAGVADGTADVTTLTPKAKPHPGTSEKA